METKTIDQIMAELHKKINATPTGKEWKYQQMLKELDID